VDPNGLVVLVDEALFSTTGRSLGFSLSATLSHLIVNAEITTVVHPERLIPVPEKALIPGQNLTPD
jgi:hypothetical protein